MRTNVGRRTRTAAERAVGEAERIIDAAALEAASGMRLEIEELEDVAEQGRADIERRLENIESQDSARRRAEQEGEKQRASIITRERAPGVQK